MAELGLTVYDVIGLVLILVFMFVGLSRGFMQELFKLIKWVLSLVGAKILSFFVADYAYEFFKIDAKLTDKLTELVSNLSFTSIEATRKGLSEGLEELPFVGGLLNKGLSEEWGITDILQKASADMQSQLVSFLKDSITPIVMQVLEVASFVALFIVIAIILNIIFSSVHKLFHKSKALGALDNLLGGVLGLIKGALLFLILYSVLFLIFTAVSPTNLEVLQSGKFYELFVGVGEYLPK